MDNCLICGSETKPLPKSNWRKCQKCGSRILDAKNRTLTEQPALNDVLTHKNSCRIENKARKYHKLAVTLTKWLKSQIFKVLTIMRENHA